MTKTIFVSLLALSFVLGLFSSYAANKSDNESAGNSVTRSAARDEDAPPGEVVAIRINGMINSATMHYIADGIDIAQKSGAEALIIQLDTPGGLLNSTKDIVKLILNSPVPVVVYVSPSGSSATSAGVFITLSANIAAMAEGTSIGAAHPVTMGGGGGEGNKSPKGEKGKKENEEDGGRGGGRSQKEIMGEKVENYAASFIQSIAEKRKRNTQWAIEAVRNSASLTSSEALKKNVIDLIAVNMTDLLRKIDGTVVELPGSQKRLATKGAAIRSYGMTISQKIVNIISDPNIALLLLSLGSLGLTTEIFKPGMIFPGVVGFILFISGCIALQILPFNYAGLILLIVALALFAAELFVTSYGLLAIAGLVSFVFGGLLLFKTPEMEIGAGLAVVLPIAITLGLFFTFVAYYIFRAQQHVHVTGPESLVGKQGEALTEFDGMGGKVFVYGEYWGAESNDVIHKGDRVEVVEIGSGMRLKVRKV